MATREPFKQVGALLLPSSFPDLVGLGCPKCDRFVLVSPATMNGSNPETTAFMLKHADCGPIEQIEEHGQRIRVTGTIDARGGS